LRNIAVFCNDPVLIGDAEKLAANLSLPLLKTIPLFKNFSYLLKVQADGLGLWDNTERPSKAIYIDFVSEEFIYRINHGGGKNQAVARAVGIKSNFKPYVLDTTAGLGRDGFVLAALGCKVVMIERNKIIHALLQDGLKRAAQYEKYNDILSRIKLIFSDSKLYLQHLLNQDGLHRDWPDVIYIDPMFPDRNKSAKVKKSMATMHEIVGIDENVSEILALALKIAKKRVVIKRLRLDKNMDADNQIIGKTNRFDVYFPIAL